MSDNQEQVLLTYSVLDDSYENGKIRFVGGLQDADAGSPAVPCARKDGER
jgi:hypothetical protein